MKSLARRYVWWPGLDSEIEGLARGCKSCTAKKTAPPRATLHPWEPATQAWERLHLDFAGPFQSTNLLIVYDSYTKWIEAIEMKETTATKPVHELRDLCARFGVPAQIVSDNGPQFLSRELTGFTENNGIKHIRVAPYHQSSNGAAERAVQTVKNAPKASARDGGTLRYRLQRSLLAYRIAPHAVTGRSPAELMLGWHPRTRLDHLCPDLLRRVKDAKEKEVDRKPGVDRALQVDDDVWARCFTGRDKWRLGRIRAATGPRLFEVDVGDDVIWSRHTDQLWPANNRRTTPRPAQDTTVRPGVTPLPVREAPPPVYLTPPVQEQQRGSNQTAEEDIRPSAERGPPTPTGVGPSAERSARTVYTGRRWAIC